MAKKSETKVVYLAGPMNGYRELNFPEFDKAADYLRSFGYKVHSPAENNVKGAEKFGCSRRLAFSLDTDFICLEADAVALLPGWENSPGAFAEWALARALGHEIIYLIKEEYDPSNTVNASV